MAYRFLRLNGGRALICWCAFTLLALASQSALGQSGASMSVAYLGAGQATLQVTGMTADTASLALLPSGASCGDAAKTQDGEDSTGAKALRTGAMKLTSGTGSYTFQELLAGTSYVACVADANSGTGQASFTTSAMAAMGNAWTALATTGAVKAIGATSLAFAPDSTPYVAFSYRSTTAPFKPEVMSYSATAGWSGGLLTAKTASGEILAFAPDGTPYVAFADGSTSPASQLSVMKYSAGAWGYVGSPGLSTNSVSGGQLFAMAIGPDGAPYIAYAFSTSTYSSVYVPVVKKYNNSTGAWDFVGSGDAVSSTQMLTLCLAIGLDGTPYLAYREYGTSRLHVMKYAQSSWTTIDPSTAMLSGQGANSLKVGPDGALYLAYQDAYNGYAATVMKYTESSGWTAVGRPGFATGTNTDPLALTAAPDGSLYLVYLDANVVSGSTQLYSIAKFDGANWTPLNTLGVSIVTPSLAFAPDGTLYVAYATSVKVPFSVNKLTATLATPTVAVAAAPSPTTAGATPTKLTATISYTGSAAPTGVLIFQIDHLATSTMNLSSCTSISGALSCSVNYDTGTLAVGSHTLAAMYGGDSNYGAARSDTGSTLTVNQATPTVTLASGATAVYQSGTLARVQATVAFPGSVTPTGSLSLQLADAGGSPYSTGTAVCVGQTSPLTCTGSIDASAFSVGGHTLTATYPGDTNYTTATSAAGTLTVTAPSSLADTIVATPGANQVKLQITAQAAGLASITILDPATNATTCNSAAKIAAGQDDSGAQAYRMGSLTLSAGVAGSYTMKNLAQSKAYTVCLANANGATSSATFTTTAESFANSWTYIGDSAGFSAGQSQYVSLAFSPDGAPYVAYADQSSNTSGSVVVQYYPSDAAGWTYLGVSSTLAGAVLNDSGTAGTQPQLAFSPDGSPYVAYLLFNTSSYVYQVVVRKYDASAASNNNWAYVGSPISLGTTVGDYVRLAFSPDGSPYVAYLYEGAQCKPVVQKYDAVAGVWRVIDSNAYTPDSVSAQAFTVGPDGAPYLAFEDAKASVMKYDGTAWTYVGPANFTSSYAAYLNLSFAPDGELYFAYDDVSYSTVRKYVDATKSWDLVGAAQFDLSLGSGGASYNEHLAFAADGTPYLLYAEHTGASAEPARLMRYDGLGATGWEVVGPSAGLPAGYSSDFTKGSSFAFSPGGTPYVAFQLASPYKTALVALRSVLDGVTVRGGSASITYSSAPTTLTAHLEYASASGTTPSLTQTWFQVNGSSGAKTYATCAVNTAQPGLIDCTASYDTSALTPSATAYPITVGFDNDGHFAASSDTTPTLTVSAATPTLTVSNAATVGSWLSSTTLTAYVAYPGVTAPSGAVTFQVDGVTLVDSSNQPQAAACSSGPTPLRCTLAANVSALDPGSRALTATIAADTNYLAASSPSGGAALSILKTPTAVTVSVTQKMANQATFSITSGMPGMAYLTVLDSTQNGSAGCGAQLAPKYIKLGQDGAGNPAYRIGSLSLTANASGGYTGSYTVRNLVQNTAYTLCVADSYTTSTSTSFTTAAGVDLSLGYWTPVNSAGFTPGYTVGGVTAKDSFERLAMGVDGQLYLAYANMYAASNSTLYPPSVMDYNGSAWTTIKPTDATVSVRENSLAVAPDGSLYYAYIDQAPTSGWPLWVWKYDGANWTTLGGSYLSSAVGETVSLAAAPDGTPYIAYLEGGVNGVATVKKYDAGRNLWIEVGAPSSHAAQAKDVCLAIAPDGSPYLAFNDESDISAGSGTTALKYDGSNWNPVGVSYFTSGFPTQLAIAPDGTPYVALITNYSATVMKYDAAGWEAVGGSVSSGAMSLAGRMAVGGLSFAADGSPLLAYSDTAYSYQTIVKKYDASAKVWTELSSAAASSGAGYYPSLATAPDGTPYVAYEDVAANYKTTVMKFHPLMTPTVSWPAPSSITFGQKLLDSTLTGGSAAYGATAVPGKFSWTTPTTAPGGGVSNQSVTFTPDDATYYMSVTALVSVTVNPAQPAIATTLPTASAITYGQALSASTLTGGSASYNGATVAGSFQWTTPTTIPDAGSGSQGVTFQPSDSVDYAPVTALVSVSVSQAQPSISVLPTASAITYGQALSASTLTGGSAIYGTVATPGVFSWMLPTTIPAVGASQQSVLFTPTSNNYKSAYSTVSVTVGQAAPAISWAPPSTTLPAGASLSNWLNAAASVSGSFTYTAALSGSGASAVNGSSALSAGSYVLTAIFTPTDTVDYASATANVSVTVVGPSLSSLSPSAATAGGAQFTLTINGSGFAPGSVVYWTSSSSGQATALATTYVSDRQLTAIAPASLIASASDSPTVYVQTASGSVSAKSGVLSFQINSSGSSSYTPTITAITATVTAGDSASYPVTLPAAVDNSSLTVTCLNLPAGAACSYSSTSKSVVITTSSTTPSGSYQITVVFHETVASTAAWFFAPFLLLPVWFFRRRLKANSGWALCLCLVLLGGAAAAVVGCGGGSSSGSGSSVSSVTTSGTVTLVVK